MIEDIVSSIIEAENRARDMVLKAEKDGEKLLADTQIQIEQQQQSKQAEDRKYFAQQMQIADRDADALRAEKLEQYKKEVDGQISKGKKNADKAVKYILESIK